MRRIEPAYPDLLPSTHVVRPGYLPGSRVSLDPIRMGIVWEDAPRRILPANISVPRHPVRAIAFARVTRERPAVLHRLLERGSSVLLVLDDLAIGPEDLGLEDLDCDGLLTVAVAVLPSPLSNDLVIPERWLQARWGAVLGLFPFPGAEGELERRIERLRSAGASFALSAPLFLTPKDRHRILDGCDGSGIEDGLENCLFHGDPTGGLHALERCAGISLDAVGIDPVISTLVPHSFHPKAVRTAQLLRLWARRLDQIHEEGSRGWRLRRAATALEPLQLDPETLADEDNLRVIPGFDPWVESFARSLWNGGDPAESVWRRWAGLEDTVQ